VVNLLVISIMECAVSDAHVGFVIVSVRVLLVALKEGQGGNPIPFLDERGGIRHFVLDLLLLQSLLH
jgi:hypothetical protein